MREPLPVASIRPWGPAFAGRVWRRHQHRHQSSTFSRMTSADQTVTVEKVRRACPLDASSAGHLPERTHRSQGRTLVGAHVGTPPFTFLSTCRLTWPQPCGKAVEPEPEGSWLDMRLCTLRTAHPNAGASSAARHQPCDADAMPWDMLAVRHSRLGLDPGSCHCASSGARVSVYSSASKGNLQVEPRGGVFTKPDTHGLGRSRGGLTTKRAVPTVAGRRSSTRSIAKSATRWSTRRLSWSQPSTNGCDQCPHGRTGGFHWSSVSNAWATARLSS